jgi:hypothetical protein
MMERVCKMLGLNYAKSNPHCFKFLEDLDMLIKSSIIVVPYFSHHSHFCFIFVFSASLSFISSLSNLYLLKVLVVVVVYIKISY